MILSALNDYYERLLDRGAAGLSAPGYSQEKISFALVLNLSGALVDVIDLREIDGQKRPQRMLSVPQPEKRTAGIKPNLLWDKSSYVLGVSATSKRPKDEWAAFSARHCKLLLGETDPGLCALAGFLEHWLPEQFADDTQFPTEVLDSNLVFRLEGERQFLHEGPAARALVARATIEGAAANSGLCLATGLHLPLARLHPAIKGVNGAQSSGASIVSFNLDAFKSYGKDQGQNAPVSEDAAFGYTTALNYLLRRDPDNRQRMQVGDATVVFWAQAADPKNAEAAEFLFELMLNPPVTDGAETTRLGDVLTQVRAMEARADIDSGLQPGTRLFVLGLAPNAARLSIRYWLQEDIREFARRLADHFDDLQIEPAPWKSAPSLWRLLLATAPSLQGKAKSEDVPPNLAGELARAVLTGHRYPYSLLNVLVMRMRADHQVSGIRAALCKAVLARNHRLDPKTHPRSPPVSLDITNADPGYVLGRLFSILENVQRAALGDKINATIRDRYYGAASATPASVFPVLLRNAQHHLSRLRKDKPGFSINLEKEVGAAIDLLGSEFPRSLRIEAQGHFAIGYYHQTQARFARKDNDEQADQTDTGEQS